MAAVNGDITKGFSLVKQHRGNVSVPFEEATAGGTIRVGDCISDSGAGVAIVSADDPVNVWLGVAVSAATSGQPVKYVMALPGVVWEATLDDDATTGHVLAQTDLYAKYGIKVDPGGSAYHFVDANETTTTNVTVVKLVDAIGTVRGRVWVMANHSAFLGYND